MVRRGIFIFEALIVVFYIAGCGSPEDSNGVEGTPSDEIAVCPGEGDRYGDFKCNHDKTHRCCAKLLDENGEPQSWGEGDFWEITGQKDWQWDDKIRDPPNPGDSWCICMWATADLINSVGCENVHIRCDATDVKFMLGSYHDGGRDLSVANDCLRYKCPDETLAAGEEPLTSLPQGMGTATPATAAEQPRAQPSGSGQSRGSR
jgi:hypothetical protein